MIENEIPKSDIEMKRRDKSNYANIMAVPRLSLSLPLVSIISIPNLNGRRVKMAPEFARWRAKVSFRLGN